MMCVERGKMRKEVCWVRERIGQDLSCSVVQSFISWKVRQALKRCVCVWKRTQKRKGEREGMQGQTHTHKHTIKMKRPASLLTMNPPRQTDDDTRVVPGKQRIARPT